MKAYIKNKKFQDNDHEYWEGSRTITTLILAPKFVFNKFSGSTVYIFTKTISSV